MSLYNFMFVKVPAATAVVAAPQTSVAPTVVQTSVVSGAPGAVTPPVSNQGPSLPIQVCILRTHSFLRFQSKQEVLDWLKKRHHIRGS
jgi:hypothetical protein